MKKASLLLKAILLTPLIAFSHGSDKPGPHGGSVEMPGAFHTEVIVGSDQSAHIFLLDMNFQNATTKDSSVKVFFRSKKLEVSFACSIMANHFHCVPSKKYPSKGELVIQATREKAIGNDAVYKLPLKFSGSTEKQDSGSQHSHH